jgi:hypothetical protein
MTLVRRHRIAFTLVVSLTAHSLSPPERAAVLAAERDGGPFLVHRDAHGDLRIVPLRAGERVTIGRNAGNDVALDGDPEVSRAHAVLESAGAGWTIVDDGMSRNGTYVNGERVRRRRLADHDLLRVGATSILFRHPAMVVDDSTLVALAPPEGRITEAERRVLVELCRPLLEPGAVPVPATNGEIAATLVLSLAGVKSHVRSLFAKLGVNDLPQNRKRAELARRALELGLVTSSDR